MYGIYMDTKDAPDGRRVADIDPFTVYAIFNRGISHDKRIEICQTFKDYLNVSASAPQDFDGIPVMNTQQSNFMAFANRREDTKYYTNIMRQYYGKEKLREAHLYQINTYVNEYDKENKHHVDGMLLYAKTKEDVLDDSKIVHKDGYTLYIRTLDLNTDFETIKKRLDSFV